MQHSQDDAKQTHGNRDPSPFQCALHTRSACRTHAAALCTQWHTMLVDASPMLHTTAAP
jgi:hypothetical protein